MGRRRRLPGTVNTDFDSGVTHQGVTFPPVGVRTLARNGSGPAATLGAANRRCCRSTPDSASAVLGPTASAAAGQRQRRRPRASSKVGIDVRDVVLGHRRTRRRQRRPSSWRRRPTERRGRARTAAAPVLQGHTLRRSTQNGVYAPDVVYDAGGSRHARTACGTRAGPASSARSATRRRPTASRGSSTPELGQGLRSPVLEHGRPARPTASAPPTRRVIKDGSTWKMWYTGDDSSKKRVAYATSTDGVTWAKGGKVIAPEDPGVEREPRVRRVRADRLEDGERATRCC